MAFAKLDQPRTYIYISSSIGNFRKKLTNYLQLPIWHWWENRHDQVIFFGMYHWKDYLRFIWHRGSKKVFWCGSDILALEKNKLWLWLIRRQKAKHYVENEVEWQYLQQSGIDSQMRPMLFDDPDNYPVSFRQSKPPNVYISCHKGREQEYGVDKFVEIAHQLPEFNFHIYGIERPEIWYDNELKEMRNLYYDLPNLIYHGQVSEQQFNQEIKDYQGFVRFNQFDGASEIMTKGYLLGQYGLVYIPYPYSYQGGIGEWFDELKKQKSVNWEASNYWRKTLKENKNEVVDNWSW